jgi:hypothetical protein
LYLARPFPVKEISCSTPAGPVQYMLQCDLLFHLVQSLSWLLGF